MNAIADAPRKRSQPARNEWQPSAWLVGGVVAASAIFYLWRNLLLALTYLRTEPSDFTNYYLAARALLSSRSPFSVPKFDYPALLAFLVAPIAWLPEPSARLVWFACGHLCLLAAGILAWRSLGGDRAALIAVAATWAFAGTVAENLVLGQVNPLLLLLIAGAASASCRGRPRGAAMIGVAASLKLWPIVVLGEDVLARRWRSVATGAIVAVGLLAFPWAYVAALRPLPHMPPHSGYWMGTPALLNFSLPAVALRLLDPPAAGAPLPPRWVVGNDPGQLVLPAASAATGVAVAVVALLVGFLLVRCRSVGAGTDVSAEPVEVAALVSLALLAAPISWYHYQLLNFLGIALLATRWLRGRRVAALVALGGIVLAATWMRSLMVEPYLARYGWTAARPGLLWMATSLTPAAGIVLFGLLLGQVRVHRSPGDAVGKAA